MLDGDLTTSKSTADGRLDMLSQHAPLSARFVGNLPNVSAPYGPMESNEAQLIAASREGDVAAYGSLVCKYQDRLCASLRHVCGSVADAQDAAQEAFLRGYLKLSSYTGASAFYTWLYRIALNVAISEHRRRRVRSAYERSRFACDEALREPSEGPDGRLLREERVAQVQKALDSLTADHRTILVLREIENCDYDEIAGILAIPVGTVRSRLHRARLELREHLRRSELQ
jgi:RNA polymerase sigma-70 factor, ECF subfamily